MGKVIKFIDLFAGLGGMRIGFESAVRKLKHTPVCVFTSEIKPYAIEAYKHNFSDDNLYGDICDIHTDDIPDFDVLLAGFPCQPFSSAGTRGGFMDTRGTLFFEIERILEAKNPDAFLLENVEGLVTHDRLNRSDTIGRTLTTIIQRLEAIGYNVSWKVLDSQNFGIPQSRKRIYITGSLNDAISLDNFKEKKSVLREILQSNLPPMETEFTQRLLEHYEPHELHGKSIKDKRGGNNNIHSWDIEVKGETSPQQRVLLRKLLRHRRRKHWAEKKGIVWMDGMPLTLEEIQTFYTPDTLFDTNDLKSMLDDLVEKGYLVYEHPKDLVTIIDDNGNKRRVRQYAEHVEKGYNIVVGKLSFEITKILDPKDVTPTLVATDVTRLAVVDGEGLRRLTIREGLRLFGFPEPYELNNVSYQDAFDLLGNTVAIPVIDQISQRILHSMLDSDIPAIEDARPVQRTLI